jgi:fluoroacetyl-CoA thioesterase
MKPTLVPGLKHTLSFTVTEAKTVPRLYPEALSFQDMPPVFATGFMVGLLEWACLEAVLPHLAPNQKTVGTHVNVSHTAATPVGMTVTAEVECTGVEGRRLTFSVRARDERDVIAEGSHERVVIDMPRFMDKVQAKQREFLGAPRK